MQENLLKMKIKIIIAIFALLLLTSCATTVEEKAKRQTSEPLTPFEELEQNNFMDYNLVSDKLNSTFYVSDLNQDVQTNFGVLRIEFPSDSFNGYIQISGLKFNDGICENNTFKDGPIRIRPGFVGHKWCLSDGVKTKILLLSSLEVPKNNFCKGDCDKSNQKSSFYLIDSEK